MNTTVAEAELPPFKPLPMLPPRTVAEKRADGSWLVSNAYELGPMHRSIAHLLEQRAAEHPERNLIAQREIGPDLKTGAWRFMTYGEANSRANQVAQALLDRGMGADDGIMILSANSIEHMVMMLGAMKARVPVAPVSVAYSLFSSDHGKLKHVFNQVKPKMVFADHGPMFAKALTALALEGVEVVTVVPAPGLEQTSYASLFDTNVGPAVAASVEAIDHATVAKYLFTSGSTGMPKGVIQTHGMMCATIAAGETQRAEPPDPNEIPEGLEWMPWNHISAGNISFNGNLNAGGTVYLDAGKPVPGLFDETIRNLREVSPLVFGSAPIAFTMLCDAMEKDATLRASFFKKMKYVGYGGATLSQDIYERFQALAIAETGQRLGFTTMYGATETQGVTTVSWLTTRVGLIGLPVPGVTLKLVPNGQKLEVRAKGPTITPGYLNRPDLTEAAFDEEGFYKLGDAAKFVDESDPNQGLVFDGRVTEDFKLSSGTWVSVGTLRTDVLAAATPLLTDAVIAGQDKDYIGLLAWPSIPTARHIAGLAVDVPAAEVLAHPAVVDFVRTAFRAHNKAAGGSSGRIARVILLTEPPSIDGHEITDKGYVNQRATLDRRAALVTALYTAQPGEGVIVV
ncbi:Tyrocidine synthase 3 [Alphaproteobacteria bacterium SO-S41]|nr:Tyrocidine synthase 3 [Alphaproteobacteria bacterium SO-S41]